MSRYYVVTESEMEGIWTRGLVFGSCIGTAAVGTWWTWYWHILLIDGMMWFNLWLMWLSEAWMPARASCRRR